MRFRVLGIACYIAIVVRDSAIANPLAANCSGVFAEDAGDPWIRPYLTAEFEFVDVRELEFDVPLAFERFHDLPPGLSAGRSWFAADPEHSPCDVLSAVRLPQFSDGIPAEPSGLTPLSVAEPPRSFVVAFIADQRHYYHWSTLQLIVPSIVGGAVLANTSYDRHFQEDVRVSRVVHPFKYFGDGRIMLPTFAVMGAAGRFFEQSSPMSASGRWGERSLRAATTGAPTLLFMQSFLGGARPGESPLGSHWHPFADDNGASGHAFIGAIPFLTAARMTDRPWLKAGFYAGSFMAGASRITDQDHYLSQVLIGWSIAYTAVAAVHRTDSGEGPRIFPWAAPGTAGLGMMWEF